MSHPSSEAPTASFAPLAGAPPTSAAATRLVVLVHGLGGSAATWDHLLRYAVLDPALRAFRFERFVYATGLGQLHPLRRLPSLDTIATNLRGFLDRAEFAEYQDVRLVGHSQGGLIIQRYLHDMLTAARGRELDRVRQILFFATPTMGSTLFGAVRRLLFAFLENPQERELRVFNPAVARVRRYVEEHVTKARERGPDAAQIPIHVFFGEQDNVVDPESAMSSFSSSFAIPGDHSSLIAPADPHDTRYRAFVDALDVPIGHRHVFEVDRSDIEIRFEPHDPADLVSAPMHGGGTRAISTTSVTRYTRRVRMSRGNRCRELFEMRYATQDDGYIAATVQPPNEWPDHLRHEYDQRGTMFRYHFHPPERQAAEFGMFLTIHRGFERGNRNVHFHVSRASETSRVRFREWHCAMDFRALVAAGWRVTRAPSLRLLDVDRRHEDCPVGDDVPLESRGPVMPAVEPEPGLWRWTLHDLQRGVVHLEWDVEEPATSSGGDA